MGERAPARPLGHLGDELEVAGGLDRLDQRLLAGVGHGREDVDVELAADDGGGHQDLAVLSRQPGQPPLDDVDHADRQQRGRLAVLAEVMGHQLLDEERVALAAAGHLGGQPSGRFGLAGQLGRERHRRLLVQPGQRKGGDHPFSPQLAQDVGQRVGALGLGRSEGDRDQESAQVVVAAEVADESARGRVGPVDVVEEEGRRLLAHQLGQQGGDRFEQDVAVAVRLVGGAGLGGPELGQEAAEDGGPRSQALDHALGRGG